MRVGIDIDGTVTQTFELWEELVPAFDRKYLNSESATVAPEMVREWYAAHQKVLRRLYQPYPGTIAILHLLDNPRFITGRNTQHEVCPATVLWLHRHGLSHISLTHTTDKVFAGRDVDVFIEDNPDHAQALAHAGKPVLLKDQPYNQDVEHENIIRFTHWLEVPRLLKKLQKQ